MINNAIHIKGYHAHVYYDEQTFEQAQVLCGQAGELFNVSVGHMHKQAVGPHPMWSCQLAFKTDLLSEMIPWLSTNRKGLTVFIHGISGNDLLDHTDYAVWMGSIENLDLSIFE
ncbi:MAG: DOPA 4,5-dioxygenase family protein [Cellvibrionaceae bacterium]